MSDAPIKEDVVSMTHEEVSPESKPENNDMVDLLIQNNVDVDIKDNGVVDFSKKELELPETFYTNSQGGDIALGVVTTLVMAIFTPFVTVLMLSSGYNDPFHAILGFLGTLSPYFFIFGWFLMMVRGKKYFSRGLLWGLLGIVILVGVVFGACVLMFARGGF